MDWVLREQKEAFKRSRAAARAAVVPGPMTVGKVVLAVILGNVATGLIGLALYELLHLL